MRADIWRTLYQNTFWLWVSAIVGAALSVVTALFGQLVTNQYLTLLQTVPMILWLTAAVMQLRSDDKTFLPHLLFGLQVAGVLLMSVFSFGLNAIAQVGLVLFFVSYFWMVGILVREVRAHSQMREDPVVLFGLICFWILTVFRLKRQIDALLPTSPGPSISDAREDAL